MTIRTQSAIVNIHIDVAADSALSVAAAVDALGDYTAVHGDRSIVVHASFVATTKEVIDRIRGVVGLANHRSVAVHGSSIAAAKHFAIHLGNIGWVSIVADSDSCVSVNNSG